MFMDLYNRKRCDELTRKFDTVSIKSYTAPEDVVRRLDYPSRFVLFNSFVSGYEIEVSGHLVLLIKGHEHKQLYVAFADGIGPQLNVTQWSVWPIVKLFRQLPDYIQIWEDERQTIEYEFPKREKILKIRKRVERLQQMRIIEQYCAPCAQVKCKTFDNELQIFVPCLGENGMMMSFDIHDRIKDWGQMLAPGIKQAIEVLKTDTSIFRYCYRHDEAVSLYFDKKFLLSDYCKKWGICVKRL